MALTYQVDIANKSFKDDVGSLRTIISDFSIALTAGEFVSLLGPSGAGKSTLLNIVSGLDSDYQGEVKLNLPYAQPARVALMFQEPRLMPWLTICDNVMLVCEGASSQRRSNALYWLQQVGLSGAEHQYPAQLSGGMLKRAALARAFACEPDILLMDEPFSSLDIPAADSLRQLLTQLWQARKTTVVYVTHDITEAITLSDRILLLSSQPMQVLEDVSLTAQRPRNPLDDELFTLSQRFKQSLADPA